MRQAPGAPEKASFGAGGAVALIVFVVLAWGGAAGPHPFDVGELAAATARLGGSHAPGQPLHALLGYAAATVMPLGPWLVRLSWLSALGAALAAYACGRAVLAAADRDDRTAQVLACAAALAVVLLPAVVRNAMRPEVYTLALAAVTSSAWALCERARGWRPGLRVAAILAGLAFALHPPHALAIAAMGIVACVLARPSRRDLGASIALGLVVTIALIAYLPIRASAGAPCWGDPTTPAGLWAYVSGAPYQHNLGAGSRDVLAVARYLVLAGGAPIVLAPLLLRDRDLRLPWGLAAVAIVAALLQPFEERNPDNVAYDAPALALVIVAAAASLARFERRIRVILAFAIPIAPLAATLAGHHLASADLPALETLAFETISSPAPRAFVLTRTDFVAASVMQSVEIDRVRPDIAHLVEGLATSSWHWRSLAVHPAFDGEPHRGSGSDAHEAYVRGAIDHARGVVEIDFENSARFSEHGLLRGALLVRGVDALVDGVADRSTAERTMGAIASSLAWPGLGDHEAGAQIIRDVVIRRSGLLVERSQVGRAQSELRIAAPSETEAIAEMSAPIAGRSRAWLVRDPTSFLAAQGDVVRQLAVLLDQSDHLDAALRSLSAQQRAGDDLAILELAAIQLRRGDVGMAQTSVAAYRAEHPDARSPDLEWLDAALVARR